MHNRRYLHKFFIDLCSTLFSAFERGKKGKLKGLNSKIVLVLLISALLLLSSASYAGSDGFLSKTVVSRTVYIRPGDHYVIFYNATSNEFSLSSLPIPKISSKAWLAIESSPEWLRSKLIKVFEDLGRADINVGANSTVAFADLNGDHLIDMVCGSADGKLYYFENVGTSSIPVWMHKEGVFAGIDVGEDSVPAFADLNGDGLIDLTVGSRDGKLYYFENVGSSTAPKWIEKDEIFSGISVPGNSAPTFADLNGDGLFDLTVGSRDGKLYYYCNIGNQTNPKWKLDETMFPAWIEDVWDGRGPHYEGVWVGNYSKPSFADLEGNGKLYMFIGVGSGEIYVFKNVGTIDQPYWQKIDAFEKSMDPKAEMNGIPQKITTGIDMLDEDCVAGFAAPSFVDINNDGRIDLFIGSEDGYVYYIKNHGSASLPKYPVWKSGAEKMLLATWFWGPAYYPEIDRLTMVNVTTLYQDYYADIILNTEPKYRDEVAYVIANDRPSNLRMLADRNAGNLTVINAESIYEIADKVKYAKILEKEDYTTLRYKTESGWRELPKEVYYKYLVMFNRYLLAPWAWPARYNGQFYRTFLPYDTTYNVSLYERVGNAKTLYEAAYLVDYWIRVDIGAWWHFGTKYWKPRGWYNIYLHAADPEWAILCGEFSILYEVAARSMLIPTINIVDIAEDHQFNNFWYEGWHHVDASSGSSGINGTWVEYFDSPDGLGGWYKEIGFSYPMEWEENGRYDVPWRSKLAYSKQLANVYFYVHDKEGRPIDGARVEAWSHWTIESGYDTAPYIAGFNFTDLTGKACIERLGLGRTNNFTFIITTKIGSTLIGAHITEPKDYYFDVTIGETLPPIAKAEKMWLPKLGNKFYGYLLDVNFTVKSGMQEPPDWIHILYAFFGYKYCYNLSKGVNLDFYVVNEDNYKAYLAGYDFKAYVIQREVQSGGIYHYPFLENVYIIFANRRSLTTTLTLNFTATAYHAHTQNQTNLVSYYMLPGIGAAVIFATVLRKNQKSKP